MLVCRQQSCASETAHRGEYWSLWTELTSSHDSISSQFQCPLLYSVFQLDTSCCRVFGHCGSGDKAAADSVTAAAGHNNNTVDGIDG